MTTIHETNVKICPECGAHVPMLRNWERCTCGCLVQDTPPYSRARAFTEPIEIERSGAFYFWLGAGVTLAIAALACMFI